MQYATIEGVDKPVSRLVLGTMIISDQEGERSFALLDATFELGGNTLDTAHGYGGGHSERGIGQWMAERGNREQVVIVTKGCHHNADRKRVTPFDLIGRDVIRVDIPAGVQTIPAAEACPPGTARFARSRLALVSAAEPLPAPVERTFSLPNPAPTPAGSKPAP